MIKSLLYTFKHNEYGNDDVNKEINKDLGKYQSAKVISHKVSSSGGNNAYSKKVTISILIEV